MSAATNFQTLVSCDAAAEVGPVGLSQIGFELRLLRAAHQRDRIGKSADESNRENVG
jgi:hypothetical protein